MNTHFDLISIGGGSGGLAVAEKAAELGKRVAIIEGASLGGTCVNNGCVPKKLMWYAANLAQSVDQAGAFGIEAVRGPTDWQRLVAGRNRYIEGIRDYWQGHVTGSNITRIQGYARFVDTHRVEVNGDRYSADRIVIATGGSPLVPPVPGAELGITSDGFFELDALPERVAIIGGGYIGTELAGVLHSLGAAVTLIGLEDRVLEQFDPMLSEMLMQQMRTQGIRIQMPFEVAGLERENQTVNIRDRKGRALKGFDCVIWAVGRRPNTGNLNLDAAGVTTLPNGMISVDEDQNTNVPGIYAIGDITPLPALTPVAIAAGRHLAERLYAPETARRMDYDTIPSVVFAHPPVASVGLTEPEARARHDEITIYETRFTPMRHALSNKGEQTGMKLVCAGEEQRVVGIHMIGDSVDEILQGFAIAVKMGATKADFDTTIAIHPVSAEELVTMKQPRTPQSDTPIEEADIPWPEAV